MPLNKAGLLDTVQKILNDDGRANPFKDNRPSDGWFIGFLVRHREIAMRHAESIDRGRASLTEEGLRHWFKDCEEYFQSNDIAYVLTNATRQYNGDETGFQLDPKSQNVIAVRGEYVCTQSGAGKDQITVLVTTRADGIVVAPCVVYPYKRGVPPAISETIPTTFRSGASESCWMAGVSESGWMTSAVFFEFMANCFIPWLSQQRREEKVKYTF
jgi:hypothetical protein